LLLIPFEISKSDVSRVKVITPLLIIRRVATRNALTSATVVSGTPTANGMTFRTRTAGKTATNGSTLPVDFPLGSMDNKYKNQSYEETTVDLLAKV